MTPKKAVIIVLILFLIMVLVFVFLYLNNQAAVNQSIKQPAGNRSNNVSAGSASQAESSPVQQKIQAIETKTDQQVEQIVEQGQTSAGGLTAEAQRKMEEAVNQEIMEKIKLKTPEQLKADQARQAELEKAQQEVNQQIRSQLQNK